MFERFSTTLARCAEDDPVTHSLDGLRNPSQDPESVPGVGKFRALDIIQLEAEFPDQIVVNKS